MPAWLWFKSKSIQRTQAGATVFTTSIFYHQPYPLIVLTNPNQKSEHPFIFDHLCTLKPCCRASHLRAGESQSLGKLGQENLSKVPRPKNSRRTHPRTSNEISEVNQGAETSEILKVEPRRLLRVEHNYSREKRQKSVGNIEF
jgi:hypothetical protein